MGAERLRIDTSFSFNQGEEIARFWDPQDSTRGNNFGGTCPSNDPGQTFGEWWSDQSAMAPGLRGVRGSISGVGCFASSCPDGDLVLVVEDWGPSGPPGYGDTAFFVALRTPLDAPEAGGNRRWDFALVDNPAQGDASPTTIEMGQFPEPLVVSSDNLGGGQIGLDVVYPDVAPNVHAVRADGTPLPASSVVAGYDLYEFVGISDPGRTASEGWTLIDHKPYEDGPADSEIVTSCPPTSADTFLALGLTFEGGSGPEVKSALVGRSVQLECGGIGIPSPAGAVPDDREVPGEPLRIGKITDQEELGLRLTWAPSCRSTDVGYEVYEGLLGDFTSHAPLTCDLSGEQSFELLPAGGNRYYIVVPIGFLFDGGYIPTEGSYGRNSEAEERPQNILTACLRQSLDGCP
jgi:hypothetical protein